MSFDNDDFDMELNEQEYEEYEQEENPFGDEIQESNEMEDYEQQEYSDVEHDEVTFEDEFKARERAGGRVYKEGEEDFVYLTGIDINTPVFDIYKKLSNMDLSPEEKSKQVLQLQYRVFVSELLDEKLLSPLPTLEYYIQQIKNIKRFRYINIATFICGLICLKNKQINKARFDIVYERIGKPQKIAKYDLVKYCRYWLIHLI